MICMPLLSLGPTFQRVWPPSSRPAPRLPRRDPPGRFPRPRRAPAARTRAAAGPPATVPLWGWPTPPRLRRSAARRPARGRRPAPHAERRPHPGERSPPCGAMHLAAAGAGGSHPAGCPVLRLLGSACRPVPYMLCPGEEIIQPRLLRAHGSAQYSSELYILCGLLLTYGASMQGSTNDKA